MLVITAERALGRSRGSRDRTGFGCEELVATLASLGFTVCCVNAGIAAADAIVAAGMDAPCQWSAVGRLPRDCRADRHWLGPRSPASLRWTMRMRVRRMSQLNIDAGFKAGLWPRSSRSDAGT